jgi:chromosome segregation ATPase
VVSDPTREEIGDLLRRLVDTAVEIKDRAERAEAEAGAWQVVAESNQQVAQSYAERLHATEAQLAKAREENQRLHKRIAALVEDDTRMRKTLALLDTPAPSPDDLGIAALIPDAIAAAEKAMTKFPQPNYVISKWAEETGEVTKALIHAAEGRETWENVRGELVQSLAMLHRLFVEGDQVHNLPPLNTLAAATDPAMRAAIIERAGK